ncbi:MAG: CMP/dCMP kinase [Frankiales bacterium]|nr:CMP/dCMP kinase [Frankiales bacterium]
MSAAQGPVVAVDGPSGSGKSTLSRAVARSRGWRYLDTGAMYRAVALAVLERGADPSDTGAVVATARSLRLEPGTDPDDPRVVLDGQDVSTAVRSPEVTAAVSLVAAVPEVRQLLVELQREIAAAGGIVVEGRDIGSVVLPEASLKVWLTADPVERARRRSAEYEAAGVATTAAAEAGALARRDALDAGRTASPAVPAPDAVEVDSTSSSIPELVSLVLAELDRRSGP